MTDLAKLKHELLHAERLPASTYDEAINREQRLAVRRH